jgi:cyclin-dependent kinase
MQQIGYGTHGVVHVTNTDDKFMAIKVITLSNQEGVSVTALREIRILAKLTHVNIVSMLGVERHGGDMHIHMEYYPLSLKSIIPVVTHIASRYTRHLLNALVHCHSIGVLHRDIKPENLLIGCCGNLKLADFGLSRDTWSTPGETYPYTPGMVTLWYRSIEVLRGKPYSFGIDIWSVGCVLFEMLVGEVLFKGTTEIDMLHMIDKFTVYENDVMTANIPSLSDIHAKSFVSNCLNKEAQRFNAKTALEHPFVVETVS